MYALVVVLMTAGISWMAVLVILLALEEGLSFRLEFHFGWPPVRLGRPRRSTWAQVMSGGEFGAVLSGVA